MAQTHNNRDDAGYYRRLLQVSEAANSHLELAGMLESLTAAMGSVVPLDGAGVVAVGADGMLKPYSIHVVGTQRKPGETVAQIMERVLGTMQGAAALAAACRPIEGSTTEYVRDTHAPLLCNDLNDAARFTDLDSMLDAGVLSFVCVPLFVQDRFLGAIYYLRKSLPHLDVDAMRRLEEVTIPVAMAVANSIAYEEIRQLRDRLAQELVVLREEVDVQGMFDEIVGKSQALRRVLDSVQKVAATDSTVLILGETGTGKELIARAIHKRSRRSSGPLISVNCAALPNSLISSELFGHERGAFTGAMQRRIGRFEMAADGSVFLDEIGDIPTDVQISLLRVLQEREFERVGGSQVIRTNARIITATHRDLGAAVEDGTFRSDLYYRLNVFPIEMPPLRNRPEDIPLLVEYFALRHGMHAGKRFHSLDSASLRRLMAYPWPGNVRELENVIERAVILSNNDRLRIDEQALRDGRASASRFSDQHNTSLRVGLRDTEKRFIEDALSACGGKVSGPTGAARKLDLPASTLERKIRLHRIDKHRFHRS